MSRPHALVLTATSLVAVPRQAIDNDETRPFAMVGITWPESEQTVTAKVRVRRDRQWTNWQPMQIEADDGPDPLVTEGIQRAATEPLRVGNATGGSAHDRRSRQIHLQYGRDL